MAAGTRRFPLRQPHEGHLPGNTPHTRLLLSSHLTVAQSASHPSADGAADAAAEYGPHHRPHRPSHEHAIPGANEGGYRHISPLKERYPHNHLAQSVCPSQSRSRDICPRSPGSITLWIRNQGVGQFIDPPPPPWHPKPPFLLAETPLPPPPSHQQTCHRASPRRTLPCVPLASPPRPPPACPPVGQPPAQPGGPP
jgi:hypothetical protein